MPDKAVLPMRTRTAVCIEQRGTGSALKFAVVELTLAGEKVVSSRVVDSQYYRDLAEDAAMRWLRRCGR